VMWGEGIASNGTKEFSEKAAGAAGLKFKSGEDMIQFFFKKEEMQ